ncbi:type IV toxin-antitoxin system AbiEi family antitoxin domain-containing protein [Treponema primitia]|uniref:type IV toxin-antitoxin system AbiEi family antitoxin domain-containing protein n=1 Tax=Treponema primitia TaxID=88058 RepID=UPI000255512B|nr:type IV toxin-antitoxin system AbiEi family antitoxin domain-containing protein [Treponema primitia]
MRSIEQLKALAASQNGIIRASDIASLKIDYRLLQKWIRSGAIEKIKQGYYGLTEDMENRSEAALIAELFPDGVICMYSALFYYRYSDRTPLNWDIAINKNASKARFHLDYPYIQPYYLEATQLEYGVTTADYQDCALQIFDRDRLICECLRYENKMDREIFNKAVQGYIGDAKRSISTLLEYAKRRRILKKVKDRIGIWL